jgi:selenocysteine-specific elongation factor
MKNAQAHQPNVTHTDTSVSVILGTAGHIDHGKSSLVKALTGVDPDRLKEEKERGITIDLGFANLTWPDGVTVGIVDVPGHERLIKNMLAGAGGIDILMMVIAADEGIMPQSREHLAICNLLKIKTGIIALTKADLVDQDWIELVSDEIKEFVRGTFLEGADIIPVSSRNGINMDVLKQKIHDIALSVQPKLTKGIFRLPIDRVFTLKGLGTIVTGTAMSGTITLDAPVEILPSGITSKVRGLQSHGQPVNSAFAGRRIGINLQGVDRESLKRGDAVVPPGRFVPTNMIDAKIDLLTDAPPLKSRSIVHFYCGTAETVARVILYDRDELAAGDSCFGQFRLREPIIALSGDRYIIRRFSPLETIGGGEILDPQPGKRKRKDGIKDLALFEQSSLRDRIALFIRRSELAGTTMARIEGWILGNIPDIQSAIDQLIARRLIIKVHDSFFHKDTFDQFRDRVISYMNDYHRENPLKAGMPKEALKGRLTKDTLKLEKAMLLLPLIPEIIIEQELVRLKTFTISLSDTGNTIRTKIITTLQNEGFQPSLKNELAQKLQISIKELSDVLTLMTKDGELIRINDTLYITNKQYNEMIARLRAFYASKDEMTMAEFRDILATSRKFALPFLEYLDSKRITIRIGDARKFMLK